VNCSPNELRWWRFSIAILLRTQWDYQRWDSQNESTWRASEYDQYLHQHQQLSMRTMNEAYRTLHIKDVKRHYILRRGDPMNLDAIEKHCEQQPQVKQEHAWASSISLNLDEQRLTNVITVKSSNTLQEPARNLNKRERSCSNKYTHSAQRSELNSLLWQHVLNTYEQQRQSQMILTETQEETKQLQHNRSIKEISYSKKSWDQRNQYSQNSGRRRLQW
jgi:hypothetical protein